MRILVTGPIHYNYSLSVVESLQKLGHDVIFVEMVEFYRQCNYMERRLHKLGLKSFEANYNRDWTKQFLNTCIDFKPDRIFAINGIRMLEGYSLKKLQLLGIKLSLWLIDSIKRLPAYENRVVYFDNIYCFEENDLPYLQEKYGVTAYYCPVGFEEEAYYPNPAISRDIDISFVGTPTKNRLQILNAIANYAHKNSLKMVVQGVYWDKKYFWKKQRFANKNPKLFPYIYNFIATSEEVAEIYRKSKICLNIHILEHAGLNPRTFEIMGTNSFQLMDQRETKDMVRPGIDLITYQDTDHLLKMIKYYLANDREREQIASNGYLWVKEKFSMKKMVQNIIG